MTAAKASKCALLKCPSNLKDSVDWLLRVSNKDGLSAGKDGLTDLAKEVEVLLNSTSRNGGHNDKHFNDVAGGFSSFWQKLWCGKASGAGGFHNVRDLADEFHLLLDLFETPSEVDVCKYLTDLADGLKKVLDDVKHVAEAAPAAPPAPAPAAPPASSCNEVCLVPKVDEGGCCGCETLRTVKVLTTGCGEAVATVGGCGDLVGHREVCVTERCVGVADDHVKVCERKVKVCEKEVKVSSAGCCPAGEEGGSSSGTESAASSTAASAAAAPAAAALPAAPKDAKAYVSTYNNGAKWDELTDAEKKDCAKVLLALLPGLYRKLSYLHALCYSGKSSGGWADVDVKCASEGLGAFLKSEGYDLNRFKDGTKGCAFKTSLDTHLFTSGHPRDHLKKLYHAAVKHFKVLYYANSRSPRRAPATVKELLEWLVGLPFCPGYYALGKFVKNKCGEWDGGFYPKLRPYFKTLAHCAPTVLAGIQGSWTADKPADLYHLHGNCKGFLYPDEPRALFKKLNEYLFALYFQLYFLCSQCAVGNARGGWGDDLYGKAEVDCSSSEGEQCSTTPVKLTCPIETDLHCFLTDDANCKFKGFTKLGFKTADFKVCDLNRTGNDVHVVLDGFLGCSDNNGPLTVVCQYLTCVTGRAPETVGEVFAFFARFSKFLCGCDDNGTLTAALKNDVANLPGHYHANNLLDALENAVHKSHGSGKHVDDLWSLLACDESGKPCGKFLYPVTLKVYTYAYAAVYSKMYLYWLYTYGPKLYAGLKGLQSTLENEFADCTCCRTSSGASATCTSLAVCPRAHPALYGCGFTLGDRDALEKGGPKKCSNLLSQLKSVLGKGSPLAHFLDECEALVWSIRLPFALILFASWSAVVGFLVYVSVWVLVHPPTLGEAAKAKEAAV